MVTRQPNRSVSRRAALAGLSAGGLGLALATARPAASQDAAVVHPLVGAWRFDDPTDPANVQLVAFHPDGTLIEVIDGVGPGIGAWQATGDWTAAATSLKLDTDPDGNIRAPGTVTDQWAIEVDAGGAALTAAKTFTVRDPAGTVIVEASYTIPATRIVAGTAALVATPEASTPTT